MTGKETPPPPQLLQLSWYSPNGNCRRTVSFINFCVEICHFLFSVVVKGGGTYRTVVKNKMFEVYDRRTCVVSHKAMSFYFYFFWRQKFRKMRLYFYSSWVGDQ